MRRPAVDGVAGVLGIEDEGERPASPLRLVGILERGLPIGALDRVSRAVAPADARFKHRIVPRATLARRKATEDADEQRLSSEESGRLARVAGLWAMAMDVWGGEEETRAFLFRPHPLLEGRPPVDVVLGSDLRRPPSGGHPGTAAPRLGRLTKA